MFEQLKRLGSACAAALVLAWGQAHAATDYCGTQAAGGKDAKTASAARPAMFKIAGQRNTVYLLGSIHKLPLKFSWCNPEIEKAVSAADGFFFEANLDFATVEFNYFMDKHGYLPRGQTLHEKLSPDAQKEYLKLIQTFRIDPGKLDYLQPGVAVMLLQNLHTNTRIPLGPGVDSQLSSYAQGQGKYTGYLEDLQFQLEVLTSIGGGADVKMLEKALTEKDKGDAQFKAMFAAWSKGDLETLKSISDKQMDLEPGQRAMLLEKRNKAWIPRIEAMLDSTKIYFVTVGAMHLAGAGSVVDMLCAKGWRVDRIRDNTAASPACTAGPVRRVAMAGERS